MEQTKRKVVGITVFVYHAPDARIDDELCAYDTRLMSAIERGTLYVYAHSCRLRDGILLGMDGVAKLLRVPLGMLSSRRKQVFLSRQLSIPAGAPLYPVVIIRLFLTTTAPMCLFS